MQAATHNTLRCFDPLAQPQGSQITQMVEASRGTQQAG